MNWSKRLVPDDATRRPLDLAARSMSTTGVQNCTFRPPRFP